MHSEGDTVSNGSHCIYQVDYIRICILPPTLGQIAVIQYTPFELEKQNGKYNVFCRYIVEYLF